MTARTEDRRGARSREALLYVVAVATSMLGAALVLELWRANIAHPFLDRGDATYFVALLKGMLDNGWWVTDPRLGAPGVMSLMDFPSADVLHWVALRILAVVFSEPAKAYNVYFLLGFPLIAASGVWSARRLGISRLPSLVAGLLFTFLPYHFLRGELHLFLASYYLVPPVVSFAVSSAGPHPPLVSGRGSTARLGLRSRESVIAVALCALAGLAGVYYAFFGVFFLLVAGVIGWWRTRERARLRAVAVLAAVTTLTCVLALAPYVWHRVAVGINPDVAAREPVATFVYGLKIDEMLLPVQGHRIPALAQLRAGHRESLKSLRGGLDNESQWSALGVVASAGFVFLMGVAVAFRRARGGTPGFDRIRALSVLSVAGVLLGTVGGFGSIVARVFPWIRAYNRISVFLAFFALLALATLYDLTRERAAGAWRAYGLPAVAIAVLIVGFLDQTTPAYVPRYRDIQARAETLTRLVDEVESGLEPAAMVFQLPYVPYPENGDEVRMADYDHMKPYLYAEDVHWSYAAIRGRDTAAWQREVSGMPAERLVAELSAEGFAGVWVDRFGYEDGGAHVVGGLERALGTQPLEDTDGRYAFFAIER